VYDALHRYGAQIGARLDEERLLAWTRLAVLTVAALFLAAALLLALTIPFHVWDALAYSAWSRQIADSGNLHFSGLTALEYQRPFYYVLQGWLWRVSGFDERTGRVLALAFAVLLVVCVARLARTVGAAWAGTVAVLLLLLVDDLPRQGLSGLSDVPVAAMVALVGVLVWRPRRGRFAPAALVAASAAAALTKPSALFALAGLAAAQVVGEKARRRERVMRNAMPIAAGCVLALVWDELHARRLHMGLSAFLRAGTRGYYSAVADAVRRQVGFGLEWLGPDLRLVLVFSLAYALVRVAGLDHRRSVLLSLPVAVIASWLGPWIGAHEASVVVGPLTGPGRYVPFVALALLLLLAAEAPPELAPSRTNLARLLLWSVPPTLTWLLWVPYDSRYLSPAWPGLVVLCAVTTATGVRGAARRSALVPAAALGVLVAVAVSSFELLDGLGVDGWRQYRAAGVSGWLDQDRMRSLYLGAFADELKLTRAQLHGGGGRVFSSDGRLKFYFPGRVTQAYPRGCADLRDYRVFVLLLDSRSVSYLEQQVGASANPRFWSSCASPRLRLAGERASEFAVFAVHRDGAP
jgi:4-amino-4-deoxy-L-arabinose transferase-like glycosyltransferase